MLYFFGTQSCQKLSTLKTITPRSEKIPPPGLPSDPPVPVWNKERNVFHWVPRDTRALNPYCEARAQSAGKLGRFGACGLDQDIQTTFAGVFGMIRSRRIILVLRRKCMDRIRRGR